MLTCHGPRPWDSVPARGPSALPGRVYADHAATAPLRPEVEETLLRHLRQPLNPSSVHGAGQHARRLLEEARARLAAVIGVAPEEVVFLSGASEANNLALRGLAMRETLRGARLHVVTSALEHSCVRETVAALDRYGAIGVTRLPVREDGRADISSLTDPSGPALLALMAVQNETGALQDLDAARAWRQRTGQAWLCDAAQGLGRIGLRGLGASLVTLSSHKIGGPAGVGALAGPGVRELVPQITGGPQEHGRRAGTQAVALACAFAHAAELAEAGREAARAHLAAAEQAILRALAHRGVAFRINAPEHRQPGILSLSIAGLDGPDAVVALSLRGIDASSGAACATGVMEASPALLAMFPRDEARARSAIRISLGMQNSLDGAQRIADALAQLAAAQGAADPPRSGPQRGT